MPHEKSKVHKYIYADLLSCSASCRTVHDFQPKKFDAEQCNVLCNFAEMTMREIQRITESNMQRSMSMNAENEQLLRSIDDCSDGVVLLDVRIARWPVLFSNEGWTQLTGTACYCNHSALLSAVARH